jgi:hypothetical protein
MSTIDSTLKTPEGVLLRVTSRPPELFLRIVTPSGLEFGWPVTKGTIGYRVAQEIATLAGNASDSPSRAQTKLAAR